MQCVCFVLYVRVMDFRSMPRGATCHEGPPRGRYYCTHIYPNTSCNLEKIIQLTVLLKPKSYRAYDQVRPSYYCTEKCCNRGQIVERTYDWSQRSWVIARAKSAVARSMVMFKTVNLLSCDRSLHPTIGRTIGVQVPRLIVRSVTGCHECSYDRSQHAAIARMIDRRRQRSIVRTIGRRPSRLIVHRSLIATTSRTISYDGF